MGATHISASRMAACVDGSSWPVAGTSVFGDVSASVCYTKNIGNDRVFARQYEMQGQMNLTPAAARVSGRATDKSAIVAMPREADIGLAALCGSSSDNAMRRHDG